MPNPLSRLRANRGFTLVEMVITVAVMAILVSLSMPAIFEYLRQRDIQQEEISLTEIRKALQAYLAHNATLPSDTDTGADVWYSKLAGYTNMSESEIANDVFGRPRTYVMYQNSEREMFGNPVSVFYATVHSMGSNAVAEDTYKNNSGGTVAIPGISVSGGSFDGAGGSSASWWKKQSGGSARDVADKIVASFSALRPGGDDHLMRFTNYSEVLDRYNLTVQRLDILTQSLETFARSRYAERVSWCVSNQNDAKCTSGIPEKTIYYPRSRPASSDTEVVNGGSQNVIYDIPNTIFVDNSLSDERRREGMQNLMDELGLPRENCCSALEMAADGKPKPFYYFSNPRPRSSSGCGNRPRTTSTENDIKLPARVTTSNSSSTCG